MLRTTIGALGGALVGLALTALVLRGCYAVVGWLRAPRVFEIEHAVIYQTAVLGAGFGAVCGALAGLASAVTRELRRDR